MKKWNAKIGTPLTIISFIGIAVTGLVMLFDIGGGQIRAIHEWVGVVFVIASILHIVFNWIPFKRRMAVWWVSGLSAVMSVLVIGALFSSGGGAGGGGPRKVINLMLTAPLGKVAPILGQNPEVIIMRLQERGARGVTQEMSIKEIANSSGIDIHEAFEIVTR